MDNWNLYLLVNSETNKTYLGVTTDIERRIKQHNGLLKGGAKYTKANKSSGEWVLKSYVTNLTRSKAQSFESFIKKKRIVGLEDRIKVMNMLTNGKMIEV